jgi:DNA-nicking Smr family endonuclease
MKRPLRPEEARLWATVVATVRPAFGRTLPAMPPLEAEAAKASAKPAAPAGSPPRPSRKISAPPERIEPGRHRRIARERDPIGMRLDLHGMDQDRARAALHAFLAHAQTEGARVVLVITGKGVQGDGVLRRRVPEWLAEAPSRGRVAGVSQAERRHGGEGALYVALKR